MEEISTFLKDYTAIIVAIFAAAISLVNLIWSTRLNESRERRKTLWEREMLRFSDLEDTAGRLVEDLLAFNIRSENEKVQANEKIQSLRAATGCFLRYPEIAKSLRQITHSAVWYISRDMKHESREEYEEARTEVLDSFELFIKAIDETLKEAPKRL